MAKISIYRAIKIIQYNLAESDRLHFLPEAVYCRAAYHCLGKAVPHSDGVGEEGPLVGESSGIWYQELHVIASH